MADARELVAIAITIPNRAHFTADEEPSLVHLEHYLGRYPRFFVAPQSLDIARPGYDVMRFPDRYFGSAARLSRLLLSERFYEAFDRFTYVLIYQLDCLVFSDQLREWCEAGLDYVGAPWLTCDDTPWVQQPRVGNGGFSLRKVSSFLAVIRSQIYWKDPEQDWTEHVHGKSTAVKLASLPRRVLKQSVRLNGARWQMSRWRIEEDLFWADEAAKYVPRFRIASVEEALRFSFEVSPRYCFELAGRRMPFGCHAWQRYDRGFWEPHLMRAASHRVST